MFLVSRDQKQVVPLGSGVLALDEIVERARVLTTTKVGQSF
jgi:conjugal transfer pilus assembly protein TraF